jgi:uracil-DNA glycosylase
MDTSTVHPSWRGVVDAEAAKPYWAELASFVREERAHHAVFPPPEHTFAALAHPLDGVRVVILGQDPYHGAGQAHGLAFSVPRGVPAPPSLLNVLREVADDVGHDAIHSGFVVRPGATGRPALPPHGCLEYWAAQGVLLLNSALTVREGAASSHAGHGWDAFTGALLRGVVDAARAAHRPLVLLAWGKHAQGTAAAAVGAADTHAVVLSAAHPSPLSAARGFCGCRHFSKANALLRAAGLPPIDWNLDPKPAPTE